MDAILLDTALHRVRNMKRDQEQDEERGIRNGMEGQEERKGEGQTIRDRLKWGKG